MIIDNGVADITVERVQKQGLWHIKWWLAEWKVVDAIITHNKRNLVEL